jgi:hypothetical protein
MRSFVGIERGTLEDPYAPRQLEGALEGKALVALILTAEN